MDDDSFIWSFPAKLFYTLGMGILLIPVIAFMFLGHEPSTERSGNQEKEKTEAAVLSSHILDPNKGEGVIKIVTSRLRFQEFDPIITRVAHYHQVDPALVKAIVMAESGFDPRAVSTQGAEGLMQLMPRTARSLGVKDSFDPEHNIEGGVRYLKSLLKKFDNNVQYAVAAYNAGSSKVKKHDGVPPIRSTHIYIERVFEYYHYYKGKIGNRTSGA
ncbi:MAG: lytic transglycosylase domain-containing protein [Thermodesulfobacteriota bacterium]